MKKLIVILLLAVTCIPLQARQVVVLQWNIWHEGTKVSGGYKAIVDEIERLKPDFVTFSEVRNFNNTRFCDRIVNSLADRGLKYHSFLSYDSGLLSRHPITDSTTVFPLADDHGSVYRMVSKIDNKEYAVYTAHLDYLRDAYYNVRGYDGSTWKEVPIPTSIAEVLTLNDSSLRDDAIRSFIAYAQKDIEAGRVVILGGDFNEPSHLDWIRETKDLYDHHGLIVPWTVPLLLDNHGFVDVYRELFPNVLTHPGFTFPADNVGVKNVHELTWAPKADERDRIDYIFYYPRADVKPTQAAIFGPKGSICRAERIVESCQDTFILPIGVWPTDHKGVIVTFEVQ